MPRESTSKDALEQFLKTSENIHETHESVLSLSDDMSYRPIESRDNAVGIAIYCTQARSSIEKESYQKSIAEFCDYTISYGYSVRFFPMEIKGTAPDDRHFIDEIISKIEKPGKCYVFDKDMETLQHLEEVSKCKLFVGHKTHSTIFALATGTPLIAIAYHPKTIEFLRQFDLDNFVIDDKHLTTQGLCGLFDEAAGRLNEISKHEYARSIQFAKQIKQDLTRAINTIKR